MKQCTTSTRRTYVAEKISDKRHTPFIRLNLRWRKNPESPPTNFPAIPLYPNDLRKLIDSLRKFQSVIESKDAGDIDAFPKNKECEAWLSSGKGSYFFHRAEHANMEALVAVFRIANAQKFKPRRMYFYIREIPAVVQFLTELLNVDLAPAASSAPAAPAEPAAAALPTATQYSPASQPPPPKAATLPNPEFDAFQHEIDYEDPGYEISIRFDHSNWHEWARRKQEIEYELFLEGCDIGYRDELLEELFTILGNMSGFCAIHEKRDEIIDEEDYDDDEDRGWDMG
jgi:hypothetical protein